MTTRLCSSNASPTCPPSVVRVHIEVVAPQRVAVDAVRLLPPPLQCHVAEVLGVGAEPEVSGIDAEPYVADVTDADAFRNRPVVQLVAVAVDEHLAPDCRIPEVPVAIAIRGAGPQPACPGLVDPPPEPFLGRSSTPAVGPSRRGRRAPPFPLPVMVVAVAAGGVLRVAAGDRAPCRRRTTHVPNCIQGLAA